MTIPIGQLAPEAVAEQARELGLAVEPLEHRITRDDYTPALLNVLSNVMVWGGSRVFSHLHGIGTNEWRVLSALSNHPGATAREVCAILAMNKSIASKSIRKLLELDYVAQLDGARGSRHLYLTEAGVAVHDDCMPVAMRRQEILLGNLSREQTAELNRLLVLMLSSEQELREFEKRVLQGADPRLELQEPVPTREPGQAAQPSRRTRSSSKAAPGT